MADRAAGAPTSAPCLPGSLRRGSLGRCITHCSFIYTQRSLFLAILTIAREQKQRRIAPIPSPRSSSIAFSGLTLARGPTVGKGTRSGSELARPPAGHLSRASLPRQPPLNMGPVSAPSLGSPGNCPASRRVGPRPEPWGPTAGRMAESWAAAAGNAGGPDSDRLRRQSRAGTTMAAPGSSSRAVSTGQ